LKNTVRYSIEKSQEVFEWKINREKEEMGYVDMLMCLTRSLEHGLLEGMSGLPFWSRYYLESTRFRTHCLSRVWVQIMLHQKIHIHST